MALPFLGDVAIHETEASCMRPTRTGITGNGEPIIKVDLADAPYRILL
jgi:hypothetical protein